MPFTISHMAAALPAANKKSKLFFPALALGTMAPDFEYFIRTKMIGIYGHTTIGVFLLDLPLVIIIYLLGYHIFIPTLMPYLPRILQFKQTTKPLKTTSFWFMFLISALLGIFSHIIWDSFTHKTGFMVSHIPYLSKYVSLFNMKLPIYKLLQYGTGLLGLLILFFFLLNYQYKNKMNISSISVKQKILVWTFTIIVAIVIFFIWYIIVPISIKQYGSLVVRLIDSACLSIILLTIYLKIKNRKILTYKHEL